MKLVTGSSLVQNGIMGWILAELLGLVFVSITVFSVCK